MADSGTRRHAWLLAALVLLLFESALRAHLQVDRIFYAVLFTAVLLTGIYSAGHRGRVLYGAIAVGVPAIACQWLSYYLDTPALAVANFVTAVALFFYTAVAILSQVVRAHNVELDTILGAVVVYLLIGICFVFVYGLVEFVSPGSFAGIGGSDIRGGNGAGAELLYFSFVTLTTVGYGDIRPLTEFSRMLAATEAVVGQLYLTILIAFLVGAFVAQKRGN